MNFTSIMIVSFKGLYFILDVPECDQSPYSEFYIYLTVERIAGCRKPSLASYLFLPRFAFIALQRIDVSQFVCSQCICSTKRMINNFSLSESILGNNEAVYKCFPPGNGNVLRVCCPNPSFYYCNISVLFVF